MSRKDRQTVGCAAPGSLNPISLTSCLAVTGYISCGSAEWQDLLVSLKYLSTSVSVTCRYFLKGWRTPGRMAAALIELILIKKPNNNINNSWVFALRWPAWFQRWSIAGAETLIKDSKMIQLTSISSASISQPVSAFVCQRCTTAGWHEILKCRTPKVADC